MNVTPAFSGAFATTTAKVELKELIASYSGQNPAPSTYYGGYYVADFAVPDYYDHVEIFTFIVANGNIGTNQGGLALLMQLNKDTAQANYDCEYLEHNTGSIGRNRENRPIIGWVIADSALPPSTGWGCHSWVRIPFLQYGTKERNAMFKTSFRWTAAGAYYYRHGTIRWRQNASPIRRVSIALETGSIPIGLQSMVQVYGIRNAQVLTEAE